MPEDDVFYLQQIGENKLEQFKQVCKLEYPVNMESFMTRVKYFSHLVEFSLAVVSKTLNRESHIMKILKCCWWAPIFLISKRRRQTQFKSFVSSGDIDLILKIVRASGNDLSRFVFYFLNPKIKVHKKIYIPFEYEDLTAESLNKSLDDFILRNTKNNADSEYKFIK